MKTSPWSKSKGLPRVDVAGTHWFIMFACQVPPATWHFWVTPTPIFGHVTESDGFKYVPLLPPVTEKTNRSENCCDSSVWLISDQSLTSMAFARMRSDLSVCPIFRTSDYKIHWSQDRTTICQVYCNPVSDLWPIVDLQKHKCWLTVIDSPDVCQRQN